MRLFHIATLGLILVSSTDAASVAQEPQVPSPKLEGAAAREIHVGTAKPTAADWIPVGALPEISIGYTLGRGDQRSIRLFVDGVDVTRRARIDATSLRYTPAEPMPEGRHRVLIRVADVSHEWSFDVASAPVISELEPQDATLPSGARPTITARYSDIGSGIDMGRVRLRVRGGDAEEPVDVTAGAVVSESALTYTAPQPWPDGVHFIEVRLADRAGNSGVGKTHTMLQIGDAPQLLELEPGPDGVTLPHDAKPLLRARFKPGARPLLVARMRFGELDPAPAVVETHPDGTQTLTFEPPPLEAGGYCFGARLVDEIYLSAERTHCFTIDVDREHRVDLVSPRDGAVFHTDTIEVRVRATDAIGHVNGVRIQGEGAYVRRDNSTSPGKYLHHYFPDVRLEPGENVIAIEVRFRNGVI
jgi:hypothetical protein